MGSTSSIPASSPAVSPNLRPLLPESWEPDDDNGLGDSVRFVAEWTVRPTDFIEAGFPKLYLAAALAASFHAVGDEFRSAWFAEPHSAVWQAYRVGFATSAIFFAAAVLMLYMASRLEHGRVASTCAALVLALNIGLVTHAHFAVFDVHLVFFVTLLIYLALRNVPAYVLAGAVGLCASVKYTGGLLLPLVPLALRIRTGRWPGLRQLAACGLAAGVVFAILNPFAVIELPRFVHDLGKLYFERQFFKGFEGGPHCFLTYLHHIVDEGPFLAALMGAGFLFAVLRRSRSVTQGMSLLSALLYYLLSGWSRLDGERFVFPLLPPLALLVAPLIERMAELPRLRRGMLVLLAGGFTYSLAACVEADLLFRKDSRFESRRLIVERGFEKVASLSRACYVQPAVPEGRGVWLRLCTAPVVQKPRYYWAQALYRRILGRPPAPAPALVPPADIYQQNLRQIEEAGAECLVLSSFDIDRYFEQPGAQPATTAFLRDLLAGRLGYILVSRVQAHTWLVRHVEFVNPVIFVLAHKSPLPASIGPRSAP